MRRRVSFDGDSKGLSVQNVQQNYPQIFRRFRYFQGMVPVNRFGVFFIQHLGVDDLFVLDKIENDFHVSGIFYHGRVVAPVADQIQKLVVVISRFEEYPESGPVRAADDLGDCHVFAAIP